MTYQQLQMINSQSLGFEEVHSMSDYEEAQRWVQNHGVDDLGVGENAYDPDGAAALSKFSPRS